MHTVSKNIFFRNYRGQFARKEVSSRLFALFIYSLFFMLSHSCYAMQQTDEPKELQSVRRTITYNIENSLDTNLYEEEPSSLVPIAQENSQSWKENWFVKNIIVEFPIIGDFCHEDPSILDSICRAGKTTCMLVGGGAGMMLYFIPMSDKDDMAAHGAKSTFNMAIGMWIGTSAYNTVLSFSRACYNCIKVEEES